MQTVAMFQVEGIKQDTLFSTKWAKIMHFHLYESTFISGNVSQTIYNIPYTALIHSTYT